MCPREENAHENGRHLHIYCVNTVLTFLVFFFFFGIVKFKHYTAGNIYYIILLEIYIPYNDLEKSTRDKNKSYL